MAACAHAHVYYSLNVPRLIKRGLPIANTTPAHARAHTHTHAPVPSYSELKVASFTQNSIYHIACLLSVLIL